MSRDAPRPRRGLLSIVTSATSLVEKAGVFTGAFLIVSMMLLTTADVVGRYIFNAPIMGATEAVEMLLVGVVFLGVAYVQSRRGHVEIEMIKNFFSKKGQRIITIVGLLIGLCPLSLITWQASTLAWRAFITGDQTMGLSKIPFWPAKTALAFGIGLLCIQLLLDLILEIKKLRGAGDES